MFNRKLLKELNEWKDRRNRKPLIIRGVRQVGKTTLVDLFAKNFKQYIYLNLEQFSDKKIFEDSVNFEETLDAIFFLKNASKNIEDTLIFIDEIQNSPQAISSLRYFYENSNNAFVIAAGSLLDALINDSSSFPVGRVEFLALHPVSFQEFIFASGQKNITDAYNITPLPRYAFDKLNEFYKIYSLIGGMPEVINNYLTEKDLSKIKAIISNLVISFKDDIEKYAKNISSQNILRHIIEHSFFNAGSRIKFQGFGNSNYRSREVGEAFRLLEKTMIIKLIYPVTQGILPLIADKKKSPKLQIVDTGLINFSIGIEKEIFSTSDLSDVYRGRIAEHIVGQELQTLSSIPSVKINFWVRDKRQSEAEIDFLYVKNGKIYPVEVKAGATGKLKSLHQFIDTYKNKLAIRFYSGPIKIDTLKTKNNYKFTLLNLPYFLCGKIDEYIEWTEAQIH
ncbi:MAG: ATP-binding protein [Ignavibacteriae bacterium]|nr:DUF4143 domain-containing protein [Ignavibacteriota bacterium]NOG99021.1 ATP-binding protein [Ignavibacteriota bacterium]